MNKTSFLKKAATVATTGIAAISMGCGQPQPKDPELEAVKAQVQADESRGVLRPSEMLGGKPAVTIIRGDVINRDGNSTNCTYGDRLSTFLIVAGDAKIVVIKEGHKEARYFPLNPDGSVKETLPQTLSIEN